jgi:hypothetical protein
MYLVDDATRKPPRPANLFREEDNQTDSSITHIMQEDAAKVIKFLPTWHNLSANMSKIVNRRHMTNIFVKLAQPQMRKPTDTHTSQCTLRSTQVRCALARAYTVILQNRPLWYLV